MIRCFYADVTSLLSEETFDKGVKELVWPERKVRLEKIKSRNEQALFLGAGLLLKNALASCGVTGDLSLSYSEHGKPSLRAFPGIHFNLSHSKSLVFCGIADTPVGVDVEHDRQFSERLAAYCLTSEEYDWLKKQEDQQSAFLKLWTRKESYLKMTGQGLSISPKEVPVLFSYCAVFSDRIINGYHACICSEKRQKIEIKHGKLI